MAVALFYIGGILVAFFIAGFLAWLTDQFWW